VLLLTAEEMRALDRRTIDGGRATGAELMRRAGHGVVACLERRYGSLLGYRALVLCGTGNNGGDGFVVAARLKERGCTVVAVVCGDATRIAGDAAGARDAAVAAGITPRTATTEAALGDIVRGFDAWDLGLDALLGTGARGMPEGAIAAGVQALRELDEAGTRVIAIDVPTGVDSDTGAIARRAVRADLTVTFGAPKRGHLLYPGRAFTGELEVVDIGLVVPAAGDAIGRVRLANAQSMTALVPRRDPRAHKGTAGRVLVVGGSRGLTGAVALAARAASRAGAGYVQVAVPAGVHDVLAAKLTEQMPVACGAAGAATFGADAFDAIAAHFPHVDCVAIGPGLSRDPAAAELARRVIAAATCPVVIDADGLNALGAPDGAIGAGTYVLTPHVGEAARLTGLAAGAIEAARIDAPRDWAKRWNAVVVLKGAPTVTAAADGRAVVNPTGNAGMATAGMGDVLTGAVAALVAQGLGTFEAAMLAVHAHGLAGDLVAAGHGALGLVAGDVCEALPRALATLERGPLVDTGPA